MSWHDDRFVGVDFEADGVIPAYGLQPWRMWRKEFWPTSFVAARKLDNPARLDIIESVPPTKEWLWAFLQRALKEEWTLVCWNALYDIMVFMAHGPEFEDICRKLHWIDGMLLWKHYFIEPEYDMDRSKKKSYSLKVAVRELLPQFANYEEGIVYHNPSPEELKQLHEYNRKDTVLSLRLARMFYKKLDERQLKAAMIEARSLPYVAQANLHGMPIDTLVARELGAILDAVAAKNLADLAPDGVTEKVVRSPKQLSQLMYGAWGLPVLKVNTSKLTGNTTNSTDKEVLHELAFIDPRAKKLREFREALTTKTKFVDTPIAAAEYNTDGMARPQGIVFGTYSGRMTYASKQGKGKDEVQTGFALHQMKRDKIYRETVEAPEGYDLVEFDASGQEFRWMACASNDATMLALCQPGEDPHSFMGARIEELDYHKLMQAVKAGKPEAKDARQLGKVGNLCVIEGSLILTDRGVCNIEHVRHDDLVWDGVEFVAHDGVVCSGVEPVISHDNVTATPEHEVKVGGTWIELTEAARHDRSVEPAMGEGWAGQCQAAVRIMGGLIRRAVPEVRGALRSSTMRLWDRAGCKLAVLGDRALGPVQGMRYAATTSQRRAHHNHFNGGQTHPEACERMVPAMQQPQGQVMAQLRWARDRVPVLIGQGSRRVHQGEPSTPHISEAGHRPRGQRWSLRDWKLALGYAKAKPCQQATARVYDIVNCGPRHQFSCNGRIVHNSLQYRTSANKLRTVARVQYNLPMELPEARRIHKTYHQTYPGVPHYWGVQIALTRKLGYVETFAGRRVQVVGDWMGDFGWSMGSTAINYRIQGTGADQKYLALCVTRPIIDRYNVRFAWDLHDGLYFFCPKKNTQAFVKSMREKLDALPYGPAWGYTPPIPMPWDAKVGASWGSLKEIK